MFELPGASALNRTTPADRADDFLIIATWFWVTRRVFTELGVAPNADDLQALSQLAPLDQLRGHLAETIVFLHSQPPLFNLLVGVLGKAPGSPTAWLHPLWVMMGFGIVLAMFGWLRRCNVPRVWAHVAVLVFGLNPSLVVYENFLSYTYGEAFCVLLGLIAFALTSRTPAVGTGIYACAATVLVGVRALFHPAWAGLVVAAQWPRRMAGSGSMRRWLLAPVVAGMLLVIKNGLMFGVWATSSWFGMNVASLAAAAVGRDAENLAAEGTVSRTFLVTGFQPLDRYPAAMVDEQVRAVTARLGSHAALIEPSKSNGSPNMNHAGYIGVSRRLWRDSLRAFSARPIGTCRAIAGGLRRHFLPTTASNPFIRDNLNRLDALENLYRRALYPAESSILVIAWYGFAIASSVWMWARRAAWPEPFGDAAGYLAVTVIWVVVISSVTTSGENNRFRFCLDPAVFSWNVGVLGTILSSTTHPSVDGHL
jgi:hypothetical protein